MAPPRTSPADALRTSTSTIVIPPSPRLDLIEKRLDESLPEQLHSFKKSGVRVKCWDASGDLPDDGEESLAVDPERTCVYLDFEVRITHDGLIEVSREGEELILKLPARGQAVARGREGRRLWGSTFSPAAYPAG